MKALDLFNDALPNGFVRKPYVIAEAGVNHEGNIDLAKRLIQEASEGGANAIKFQTYKADTIASKNSPSYWDTSKEPTKSQYKLFKKYDKFWKKEFEELKLCCDSFGIEFMSTPFDLESANFLNDLMEVFKISSSDITNRPFIDHISSYKKPIILSTGASNLDEIIEAVSWINPKKIQLALLHCVLNYPTENRNAHLGMIKDLQAKFPKTIIGYSDHTLPQDMKVLEIATILGAAILEKHFTFDKNLKGNDHYHAMDKLDLRKLNENLENIFNLIGSQKKYSLKEEELARSNARRSLVAKCLIPKGSIISKKHLTWKRPAHGISPKDIGDVLGKKTMRDICEDELIYWNDLT